jgi:hypothetical protein
MLAASSTVILAGIVLAFLAFAATMMWADVRSRRPIK